MVALPVVASPGVLLSPAVEVSGVEFMVGVSGTVVAGLDDGVLSDAGVSGVT